MNPDILESILKRIEEVGNKNKEEIKLEIRNENKKIIKKLEEQTTQILQLENRTEVLENNSKHLDKIIRKNNILVFGLGVQHTNNLLAYTVNKLNDLLEIQISEVDISNIYLLKSGNTIPPIKIEFCRYISRELVIRNCNKLKGKGIYIAPDLSKEDRDDQKILLKHRNEARAKKLNARIKGKTLHINGDTYTVDQLKKTDNVTSVSPSKNLVSNSAPETPTNSHLLDEAGALENSSQHIDLSHSNFHQFPEVFRVPSGIEDKKKYPSSVGSQQQEKEGKKLIRSDSVSSDLSDRSTRYHQRVLSHK